MSGTTQAAQSASMTAAAGNYAVVPIGFGYYPKEGSRAVSLAYNWTNQISYNEDLSQLVARGVETSIQGMFVDNSAGQATVNILIEGSGQQIIIPSQYQGLFPVFFSGAPSFQITAGSSNAGAVTRIILLNVPPNSAGTWRTF
jgi:hypothetical protein